MQSVECALIVKLNSHQGLFIKKQQKHETYQNVPHIFKQILVQLLKIEHTLPPTNARMTLTIKVDRNWNSFQIAISAPPLSVTDRAIAASARMRAKRKMSTASSFVCSRALFVPCSGNVESHHTELRGTLLFRRVCCARHCAVPVQHLEASEQAQEDILPSRN